MFCAIWYHLYNLKNVKNSHGGVILLVKLAVLRSCFSRFLNCTNGTKSCKASHMIYRPLNTLLEKLKNVFEISVKVLDITVTTCKLLYFL